jgi:hypothetical protein
MIKEIFRYASYSTMVKGRDVDSGAAIPAWDPTHKHHTFVEEK